MKTKQEGFTRISQEQAKEIMDNEDVIILDVRTAEEYAEVRIPNSTLLPVDEINQRAHEVLPDKSAKILVHCRSGVRSLAATKELAKMGYTDLNDFGGILEWKYETIKGK